MGGEDEKGRRLKNLYETLRCIEYQTYQLKPVDPVTDLGPATLGFKPHMEKSYYNWMETYYSAKTISRESSTIHMNGSSGGVHVTG